MKKTILLAIVVVMIISCVAVYSGCDAQNKTYTVMTPDGAPAMAIAHMMKNNVAFGKAHGDYRIIAATAVAASFTNGEADFIIAPTNAGLNASIKLKTYSLAAVTSWGNLYVVTSDNTLKSREESAGLDAFLAQFSGKTVASIGTKAVPDVSFGYLMQQKNIDCTLTASDAALIQTGISDKSVLFGILGEPAATATVMKASESKILCSISSLWAEITGYDFPQASLFVKKSIIENDKAAVDAFLDKLSASIDYLNASAQNAKELGDFMEGTGKSTLKGAILSKSYQRMSQRYLSAEQSKESVLRFAQVLGVNYNEESDSSIFYIK